MSFQQCGPLCPQVCDAPATCSSGCAEGCFCPTGQLTDSNGQCVAPQACGQLFTNVHVHCNYVCWLLKRVDGIATLLNIKYITTN